MPNFVQEYRNTDAGMPVLTGQAGSLIAILDAALVNGGATQPVTSLTQVGTTVNAVIPADTSLENLDWLVIAGASPAGANGTVQITFIDSTHFSYQAAGGLGTITGSITYRRAPLGWTKPFSGTNLAVYRPAAVGSFPQFYLRLEETGLGTAGQREALATGYETMSDVNTGLGQFPTNVQMPINGTFSRGGLNWRKSFTADATVRLWSLIGDGATFYLVTQSEISPNTGRGINAFGAFTSFRPGDAYNVLISGWASWNATNVVAGLSAGGGANAAYSATPAGLYIARPMAQVGGSTVTTQNHPWGSGSGAYLGGPQGMVSYPSPSDSALWVTSTVLLDAPNSFRGRPRGLYTHCHNSLPFSNDYDIAINVAGLPGVTLINYLVCASNIICNATFDRYGPW